MNDRTIRNKYGLRKENAAVLLIQMVLTILGTVLAAVMLIRTLSAPESVLGVLSSTVYFLAYAGLVLYALRTHAREGDKYFQGVIYAYAAVIGIQLLQNGMFISEYGLSETMALVINVFNLIALGNTIKFSDSLGDKKTALWYIFIAVGLKLAGELILVVLMARFIRVIHVLLSMSVPMLGITLICAYLTRCYRREHGGSAEE